MIVIRLTSGWSVRLTASESMLKLRARISDETRLRTPGLSRTIATSVWRRCSPPPGSARGGGADVAVRAGGVMPGAAPDAALGEAPAPVPPGTLPFERLRSWRSLVRPVPLLDQVGQALAGRHHREDVLLLGDLEPDERRAVDRLGGPDRVVDLGRASRP